MLKDHIHTYFDSSFKNIHSDRIVVLVLLVGGDSGKQNLYPLDMDKGKFTL